MSSEKPIDKFIEDQKNKNTLSKTRRDVSLLTELGWLNLSTYKINKLQHGKRFVRDFDTRC